LVAVAVMAALAVAGGPAEARTERGSSAKRAEKVAKPPPGPVMIVISLAKQRMTVYGSSGVLGHSPVSTGRPGYRTPSGVFTVIQKSRWHRSNIYSGAPMPYMQRITWSGVALHAGVLPGYPASHGCIRLPSGFASELWGITRLGARVVVAPDEAAVTEVAHPALPVPTMTPAPAAPSEARVAEEATKTAQVALTLSDKTAVVDSEPTMSEPKLLNPLERAKAEKIRAAADAAAKTKAAKAAFELSSAKAAEANKAIIAVRNAEVALAAATAKLEAAAKAIESAKSPEAAERAKAAHAAAQSKHEEATKAAEDARATEAVTTPEAFAAARAAWDAESAASAAVAASKAADRGTEPISIFVSRKTGRLYIRQAWTPIHEAPVSFKDPEAMLGTHTYLALGPREEGGMRWLSVSMQPSPPEPRRTRRGEKPAPPPAVHRRETASSVLDRIEMSEETRKLISDKLWTGASLIVSDQGISNETGTYTDFIVLTR
jgi:hypothetical protein